MLGILPAPKAAAGVGRIISKIHSAKSTEVNVGLEMPMVKFVSVQLYEIACYLDLRRGFKLSTRKALAGSTVQGSRMIS